MGWEIRERGGRYYTRSRKFGGRVVREYIGGGSIAALIDDHVEGLPPGRALTTLAPVIDLVITFSTSRIPNIRVLAVLVSISPPQPHQGSIVSITSRPCDA